MSPFAGWNKSVTNTKSETGKQRTSAGIVPRIIRCEFGHYYDSKVYSRCPDCNPEDKEKIDRLALAFANFEMPETDGKKNDDGIDSQSSAPELKGCCKDADNANEEKSSNDIQKFTSAAE